MIALGSIMKGHSNGTFEEPYAENTPFIPDNSVGIVVADQAVHWFELTRLLAEMHRMLRNN